MRRALTLLIATAGVLCGADSRADDYAPNAFGHWLIGGGTAPDSLPSRRAALSLTGEVGHHPLTGALGTGFSMSTTWGDGWSVLAAGPFARLDLTYLFLTGFWRYPPAGPWWARISIGGRLGIAVAESTDARVPESPQYMLVRPELTEFVDVEIPRVLGAAFSPLARFGTDTPVNISQVFRWSAMLGIAYGWEP